MIFLTLTLIHGTVRPVVINTSGIRLLCLQIRKWDHSQSKDSMALMEGIYVILGLLLISEIQVKTQAIQCAGNIRCQCIPSYISCRGAVHLPDVLDSRLFPLRESPPYTADFRGNALTEVVLRRFLVVFPTIRRLILTDQLEERCHDVFNIAQSFPLVKIESECLVSIGVLRCYCVLLCYYYVLASHNMCCCQT